MSIANSSPSHSHGPVHAHHFKDMNHQVISAKEGVWVFLVTEILMFGALFVLYAIFRAQYPEMFQYGSKLLNPWLGGLNTLVLITSSLTMALAVHYAHHGDNEKALPHLFNTFLLAGLFLFVKYFEYSYKFYHGELPGSFFHFEALSSTMGEAPSNLALFFGLYFVMTGLHGIHILIGMILISWLMFRMKRGDFSAQNNVAVEGVGLYWHIVDIIWIYLFPLMYLI